VCDLGTSRTREPCSALGRSATGELPTNKFNAQWKQISLATSRGLELRRSYRQVWYRKNATAKKTLYYFQVYDGILILWLFNSRDYLSDFGQLQVISAQMSTGFTSTYIKRRKCVTLIFYSQDEASISPHLRTIPALSKSNCWCTRTNITKIDLILLVKLGRNQYNLPLHSFSNRVCMKRVQNVAFSAD